MILYYGTHEGSWVGTPLRTPAPAVSGRSSEAGPCSRGKRHDTAWRAGAEAWGQACNLTTAEPASCTSLLLLIQGRVAPISLPRAQRIHGGRPHFVWSLDRGAGVGRQRLRSTGYEPCVISSGAVVVGRGTPLQPKGAGLSGATRQRVGFPLQILD